MHCGGHVYHTVIKQCLNKLEETETALADMQAQAAMGGDDRDWESELEAEREKRIVQLANVGLRRLVHGALARGWSAWHELWAEHVRTQRMARQSIARLTKPKLISAYKSWRQDWEVARREALEFDGGERRGSAPMRGLRGDGGD